MNITDRWLLNKQNAATRRMEEMTKLFSGSSSAFRGAAQAMRGVSMPNMDSMRYSFSRVAEEISRTQAQLFLERTEESINNMNCESIDIPLITHLFQSHDTISFTDNICIRFNTGFETHVRVNTEDYRDERHIIERLADEIHSRTRALYPMLSRHEIGRQLLRFRDRFR